MDNLDARVEEAAHLVQAERYKDAAKLLEEVRAANPDHYSALLLLGQIYGYFLNKLDKARVLLTRVIKLYPQDGKAYLALGYCEANAGNHKRAVKRFEQALDRDTEVLEGHYNAGKAYQLLAEQAHREGRKSKYEQLLQKAMEHYSKAIELSPGFVPAMTNLAGCYLSLDQYDEALRRYDEALRIMPGDLTAQAGKLLTYARMGDYSKARAIAADMRRSGSIPKAIQKRIRKCEGSAKDRLAAVKKGDDETEIGRLDASIRECAGSIMELTKAIRDKERAFDLAPALTDSGTSPKTTLPEKNRQFTTDEPEIRLNEAEEKEFQRWAFKSRLPIVITGQVEGLSQNVVIVAGRRILLKNLEFRLFLRLVQELTKGNSGWVSKPELKERRFVGPDDNGYGRGVYELRNAFQPALEGYHLSKKDFIQPKLNHVRLSTHLKYISNPETEGKTRHAFAKKLSELIRSLPKHKSSLDVS